MMLKVAAFVLLSGHLAFGADIQRNYGQKSERNFQDVAADQLNKTRTGTGAADGWNKWTGYVSDRISSGGVPFDTDGEKSYDQWKDRGFDELAASQLERLARETKDFKDRDFQGFAEGQLDKIVIDEESGDGWDAWIAFGSDRQPEVPSFDKDGERGWDQWVAFGAERELEDMDASQLERAARQTDDYKDRDFQGFAQGQLDKMVIDDAEDGWDKWIAFGKDRVPAK